MGRSRIKLANLDDRSVEKLRALEADIGKLVIAYEREHRFADLTPEQIEKVQALEEELGILLLAYEEK